MLKVKIGKGRESLPIKPLVLTAINLKFDDREEDDLSMPTLGKKKFGFFSLFLMTAELLLEPRK